MRVNLRNSQESMGGPATPWTLFSVAQLSLRASPESSFSVETDERSLHIYQGDGARSPECLLGRVRNSVLGLWGKIQMTFSCVLKVFKRSILYNRELLCLGIEVGKDMIFSETDKDPGN